MDKLEIIEVLLEKKEDGEVLRQFTVERVNWAREACMQRA